MNKRPVPSEVSPKAAAAAERLLHPIERFLHVEASSGLVLVAAAMTALVIANSPLEPAYRRFIETPAGVAFGGRLFAPPVHFWVDDVLMTVFFFVAGLEMRLELVGGVLSSWRRAALPLAAALGGMLAPALLYLAINGARGPDARGWGVPMATDIAFAVGILALLGKRTPPALRVLLLALAILDDVGSILVIALFYSTGFSLDGVVVAAGGIALTIAFQRFGVRRVLAYLAPGALVWLGILRAGLHPALAGVVMGLLTPGKAWYGPEGLVEIARQAATRVSRGLAEGEPGVIDRHELEHEVRELEWARREALSPAARLQSALHPWVAFGIMPMFALANAGVSVRAGGALSPSAVSLGIVGGLVVGKPAGILLASLAAIRARVAALPDRVRWREMVVLALVAGIGFTMALFIASLAFHDPGQLDAARLAVVTASAVAGVAGLLFGRLFLGPSPPARQHKSPRPAKPLAPSENGPSESGGDPAPRPSGGP